MVVLLIIVSCITFFYVTVQQIIVMRFYHDLVGKWVSLPLMLHLVFTNVITLFITHYIFDINVISSVVPTIKELMIMGLVHGMILSVFPYLIKEVK